MATAHEPITPRMVMRETLGDRCADGLIDDMGIEWAAFVTVCAILEHEQITPREKLFLDWAERIEV